MPHQDKLETIKMVFARFAGREVPMKEELLTLPSGNKYPNILPVNSHDPVLEEMEKAAKEHGFQLRVWWQGRIGTMDFRSDRANAEIKKEPDGKWRVSSIFKLG